MLPQIETIWRLTRNMPPERQALFMPLFSEIEHVNQHENGVVEKPSGQLELTFNTNHQSNYYEPKWFNSTNGQIQ
jgi:hypothetical protein